MSAQQNTECSTSESSPTSQLTQPAPTNSVAQASSEVSNKEITLSSTTTANESTGAPISSASAAARASRKRTKTGCLSEKILSTSSH